MDSSNLNLITAVVAGLLSFASPCCLPLVPAYLSYITGVSLEQLTGAQVAIHRKQILLSAFAFVLGLAIIFTVLGASASAIGCVPAGLSGMGRASRGRVNSDLRAANAGGISLSDF